MVCRPQGITTTQLDNKPLQNAFTLMSVRDFRVKLDTVIATFIISHRGDRRTVSTGSHLETGRQLNHAITMTHPHIQQAVAFCRGVIFDVCQQA